MVRRVGLLTLPLYINFGGIIQAAALYQFLARNGKEPVYLQKRPVRPMRNQIAASVLSRVPGQNLGGARERSQQRSVHTPFIEQFLPNMTRPLRTSGDLARAARRCDLEAVVVGSDQVWRFDYHMDGAADPLAYFLDFVDPKIVRRVAYAASFGASEWKYPDHRAQAAHLLSEFHAVSAREESGGAICRRHLGRSDAKVVLDPTLLVNQDFYDDVAAGGRPSRAPELLVYVLDRSESVQRASDVVLGHLRSEGIATVEISPDDKRSKTDVPTWVRAFRDAEYIVTDSFHGTVMSIVFRKPFVTVPNRERGLDRFTSLLDALGLSERLLMTEDPADVAKVLDSAIDFAEVDRRLDRMRAESADFLLSALA